MPYEVTRAKELICAIPLLHQFGSYLLKLDDVYFSQTRHPLAIIFLSNLFMQIYWVMEFFVHLSSNWHKITIITVLNHLNY